LYIYRLFRILSSNNSSRTELSIYLLSVVLGYFIGSFPTAYLLVKWKSRLDIREAGSGNVGAMNTYDVTNSKLLSISVLMIDVLKGMCALWLSRVLFNVEFWTVAATGCGAILGHNYSPWLKFKGGRGLATAAGVMFLTGWILVVVWCGLWTVTYLASKNIHLGNVLASIVMPFTLFLVPESFLERTVPSYVGFTNFVTWVFIISALLVLSHRQPIIELWKTYITTSSAG
jgi:glycerol-3-phosphate acyltransferase PlsY